MSNVFASIGYPYWLIIAGALLLFLGLVGLAFRQKGVEAEPNAIESDQELFQPEDEQSSESGRTAKRRDRWAERFGHSNETLSAQAKE